jgi:hypothetical protein
VRQQNAQAVLSLLAGEQLDSADADDALVVHGADAGIGVHMSLDRAVHLEADARMAREKLVFGAGQRAVEVERQRAVALLLAEAEREQVGNLAVRDRKSADLALPNDLKLLG